MKALAKTKILRSSHHDTFDFEPDATVCRGSSEYHGVILRMLDRLIALDFGKLEHDQALLCAEQWFLVYLESAEHSDLKSIVQEEQHLFTDDRHTQPAENPVGFVVMELLCWLCLRGINPYNIQTSDFIEFFIVWYPADEEFAPKNIVHDSWELNAFFDFLIRMRAPQARTCKNFINERSKAQVLAMSMAEEGRSKNTSSMSLAS